MNFLTIMIFLLSLIYNVGNAHAGFTNYSTNLMGHWKLDGNANDSSSQGNSGTITGATATDDRFSYTNSSYSFNGSSTYITLGDDSALNPSTEITVSAWVNLNSHLYNPSATNIVEKDDWNGNKRDYILTSDPTPKFAVFSGGSYGQATGGSLQLNKWHHIVGTYDGSYVRIYIDGVQKASQSFTGSLNNTDTPLGFGTTNDTRYTRTIYGKLDDVRIYDRAFSDCDIRELYIEELQNKQ